MKPFSSLAQYQLSNEDIDYLLAKPTGMAGRLPLSDVAWLPQDSIATSIRP